MPTWLAAFPAAVANWREEGAVLDANLITTEADCNVFAMRCYLWDQFLMMSDQLRREGRVIEITTVNRNEMVFKKAPHPLIKQIDTVVSEWRRLGSLLGLDPASRSRLKVGGGDGKDELGEFLKGRQ